MLKAFNFLTYTTISIAMSLVFSLGFESSFVQLERILFGRVNSGEKRQVNKVDINSENQENGKIDQQYPNSYINQYPNIEENL